MAKIHMRAKMCFFVKCLKKQESDCRPSTLNFVDLQLTQFIREISLNPLNLRKNCLINIIKTFVPSLTYSYWAQGNEFGSTSVSEKMRTILSLAQY